MKYRRLVAVGVTLLLACIVRLVFGSFAAVWVGLLAPGVIVAALLFPEGIHSDSPILFMSIAGLIDVGFYGFVGRFVYFRWFRAAEKENSPPSLIG